MYKHLNLKHVLPENIEKAIQTLQIKAYLQSLHTKELLQLKNKCYKYGGTEVRIKHLGLTIHLDNITSELSKREHIPNKLQSKEIRRNNAKERS